MSGLLRSVVLATGRSVDSLVPGDVGDALVEFDVRDLRRPGFEVVVSPEEDEPAHTHVVGDKEKRSTRRLLADLARWTVTPPTQIGCVPEAGPCTDPNDQEV